MLWCEQNRVDYVFGLARNTRLEPAIAAELKRPGPRLRRRVRPARVFPDFRCRPSESGVASRRVIAKAEWTWGEANPRFIVTSSSPTSGGARGLYEDVYRRGARWRTGSRSARASCLRIARSAATMRANQLRLWLSSMAYVLMCAVRRIGLAGTELARATCGTIRLKLLKIGALVRSVRVV